MLTSPFSSDYFNRICGFSKFRCLMINETTTWKQGFQCYCCYSELEISMWICTLKCFLYMHKLIPIKTLWWHSSMKAPWVNSPGGNRLTSCHKNFPFWEVLEWTCSLLSSFSPFLNQDVCQGLCALKERACNICNLCFSALLGRNHALLAFHVSVRK